MKTDRTPEITMSTRYPRHIIDVHTHLFNARYLPLEGILLEWTGGRLRRSVSLVARVLILITGSSYHTRVEKNNRNKTIGVMANEDGSALDIWMLVDEELATRAAGYAMMVRDSREQHQQDEFRLEMQNDPLFQVLQEIAVLHSEEEPTDASLLSQGIHAEQAYLSTVIMQPSFEALRAGFAGRWPDLKGPLLWLLKKVARAAKPSTWDEFGDVLQFLWLMLQPEKRMLEKLKENYASNAPKLFVHHMMDMHLGYPRGTPKPHYEFPIEQFSRMKALASTSGGNLLGFAAIDPRREDPVGVLEEAIRLGFVGIKIYPPMGYRPAENEGDAALDGKFDEIFDRCVALDVPVFAHCTPVGFEAKKGYGLNSHPKYWKARLDRNSGRFRELRICFGHAGGGRFVDESNALISAGWDAKSAEWKTGNYAFDVVQLCKDYPNAYCELSYMHEALRRPATAQNIGNNLERAISANSEVAAKIMFGTDWHMPRLVDDVDVYLRLFASLFDGDKLSMYKEDFFWRNGLRYLALESYWSRTISAGAAPEVREYAGQVMQVYRSMEADVLT